MQISKKNWNCPIFSIAIFIVKRNDILHNFLYIAGVYLFECYNAEGGVVSFNQDLSMKLLFLCVFGLFCAALWAQRGVGTIVEDSFLLRGVVKNSERLELAVSHPVNNRTFEINIPGNGRFEKKLPMIGCGDIYLYLDPTIICMVFPGDTINIEYDAASRGYNLSGTTATRTEELQLEMLLNGEMRQKQAVLEKFYDDLYFQHGGQYPRTDTLLNPAMVYLDYCWKTIDDFEARGGALPHKKNFKSRTLYSVASYFAGDPVVYNKLFAWCADRLSEEQGEEMIFYGNHFNPFIHNQAREFCIQAMLFWFWNSLWDLSPLAMMQTAQFMIPDEELFETFCMNILYREGYIQHTPVSELGPEWLSNEIKNPYYQKELQRMIQELSQFLQPGSQAPDFTLQNSDGKKVSLHDLKGKYVYLDFWNTGCMPCIEEFPFISRLMEENPGFKEKIEFVSICVGQNKAQWKSLLQRHKPGGISLYMDNEKDKTVALYRVSAFPHYVLISPEGQIISPYFLRPSQIVWHKSKEMNYLEEFIGYYFSEMKK